MVLLRSINDQVAQGRVTKNSPFRRLCDMNDMHFATLRKAMVDSQIRPNKVIDDRVIEAFSTVPREQFVTKQMQDIAYLDEDIHLSGGRFILEAMVMSRMIQALDISSNCNVLTIGSGTGYGAAIMSFLAASVIAVETRSNMVEKAQNNMSMLEIGNVAMVKSRLQDGFASEGPYDTILIEGGVENVPETILDQLTAEGRLAAIWRPDNNKVGEACLWQRSGNKFARRSLFAAQVPVLEEFRTKQKFSF